MKKCKVEEFCIMFWAIFFLQLRHQAVCGFSRFRSPLAGLLTLLDGCLGVQKSKSTTLGQFLLTEFVRWRRSQARGGTKEPEDEEEKRNLQLHALELITASPPGYIDFLLEIYEVESLEKNLLLERIAFLQNRRCFREVLIITFFLF